jgi:predicted nuclease of predicted toxin-antitoxin system
LILAAPPGLLFDECVDRLLAVPAFAPHREIAFSRDWAPGAADPEVLALAAGQGMILVTEDVGFGRLAFQKALKLPMGIILIALHPMPRSERSDHLAGRAAEVLVQAVGAFVTIGPRRVRARRFPDEMARGLE